MGPLARRLGPSLLALAGCSGGPGSVNCTLIGCTDQLTVKLEPPTVGSYAVTLLLDGQGGSFRCENGAPVAPAGVRVDAGSGDHFLLGAAPRSVGVEVVGGAGGDLGAGPKRSGTFLPTYVVLRPNGPNCPPACAQASVTLK